MSRRKPDDPRKALREAIEGSVQVSMITQTIAALEAGVEQVRTPDGIVVERPLDKARVAALSQALNARFRLLNKVLPDLKAVEMDLGQGALGAMREYGSVERASRLLFLLEKLGLQIPGTDSTEDEEAPKTYLQ